jgi:hypothetical protein
MSDIRVLCVENRSAYMGMLQYAWKKLRRGHASDHCRAGSVPLDNSSRRRRSPGIGPGRCGPWRAWPCIMPSKIWRPTWEQAAGESNAVRKR